MWAVPDISPVLRAADEVVKAWTVEGAVPEYHRGQMWALRHKWPVLANAIDALVKESRDSRS